MKIPRGGDATERVEFILREDNPAPDMAAIQTDTVLYTCWGALESVGATYWGTAQVENRATHFLKIRKNPQADPYFFDHGVMVRTVAGQRLFRISRVTEPPEYKGMWYRLELIELGRDNPEGADLVAEAIS